MSSVTPNIDSSKPNHLNALVTGSSTGIGKAIALELARNGYRVLLHGRSDSENLKLTLAEIRNLRPDSDCLVCDFENTPNLEKFVAEAFKFCSTSNIHTWVNNAGADVLTGDQAQASFETKLERLWQVDVRATLMLSSLAGKRMYNSNYGAHIPSIINIGWDQSVAGIADESGQFFSATKGSIMAMTGSLAKSLAPNVRVNCVAPGWIKTDWGDSASDFWDNRARRESLLQRWGTPQDVASVVSFLTSEKASFINGQIIKVNGGFSGSIEKE